MISRTLLKVCLVGQLFILSLPALSQRAEPVANQEPAVPSEVLVGVVGGVSNQQVASMASQIGTPRTYNASVPYYRFTLRPGMTIDQARAILMRRGDVQYVEPNHIRRIAATPNDPSFANQYGPQMVHAPESWDIWQPSSQVILAVIDTGCDYTHEDLANVYLRDNQGAIIGRNTFTQTSNAQDDHHHGTHVAGIAAGQINNGKGIAGIAGFNPNVPGYDTFVKIMPVKVLNSSGNGTDQTVADGIIWATDHGARVINMSLGDVATSQTLSNAVTYAIQHNVVVVAAAGNNGSSAKFYPAAEPFVISVAALDSNKQMPGFSNYGSWVQIAAPGLDINSARLGGGYMLLSGTSMACPHVAGEAAALLAQYPNLTNYQVNNLIRLSVDPVSLLTRSIAVDGGLANVFKGLQNAALTNLPPPVPNGVKASPGHFSVFLSWKPALGADGYTVYRSTSFAGPYTLVASNVHEESYSDGGLTLGTVYYYMVSATNPAGEGNRSTAVQATPTYHMQVNTGGGSYTSPTSGLWAADNFFTGGTTIFRSVGISNTVDPSLYYDYRTSDTSFSYALNGIIPGAYLAKLHFAETAFNSSGQRKFNVSINGTQVISNLDVFVAAGGMNKAYVNTQPVVIPASGVFNMTLTKVTLNAMLSAFELMALPAPATTSTSPSQAAVGAPTFTMIVLGSGFSPQSVVRWNGSDLATTYASTTQLNATVPAALVSTTGSRLVTVWSPGPGGGTSNTLVFNVGKPVLAITTTVTRVGDLLRANFKVTNLSPFVVSGQTLQLATMQNVTTSGAEINTTTALPIALPPIAANNGTTTVSAFFPGTVGTTGQLGRVKARVGNSAAQVNSTAGFTFP